ncbi:MAG: peptidoglycan editing factor PgeF [Acidobacteriota bacterium]
MTFFEKNGAGVSYFVFKDLEDIPGFVHAVTSRRTDAQLKDAVVHGEVAPKKLLFLQRLNLQPHQLILLKQIHSDHVVTIDENFRQTSPDSYIGSADGIILTRPGYFSVIRTADCLPVLGVLPQEKKAFSFHAGWRGTCSRIAATGVQKFLQITGAQPEDLTVALGPCIRKCCYEVGPELREKFAAAGHHVDRLFSAGHLDLVEANRVQLEELGIRRILDSGMCTACRTDLFYSYRKEGETGRLWTLGGFRS